jgi:hypothetical protein
MEISGGWAVFGIGACGGILIELLRWWKIRENKRLPTYARSKFYWLVTFAMVLAGGGLAILYGYAEPRNALIVLNLGASAPALLGALAAPGAEERITRGGSISGGQALRRFIGFAG